MVCGSLEGKAFQAVEVGRRHSRNSAAELEPQHNHQSSQPEPALEVVAVSRNQNSEPVFELHSAEANRRHWIAAVLQSHKQSRISRNSPKGRERRSRLDH